MYVKKAECQRIDAFDLWCWRRLLRVTWTARRSNQSVLKEVNSEYSLEGLLLKLRLLYFGHLMRRASSLEKTLMLGKIEGKRRRGQQRRRWLELNGHELEQILGSGKEQVGLACWAWHAGVAKHWTWLSNWKTTTKYKFYYILPVIWRSVRKKPYRNRLSISFIDSVFWFSKYLLRALAYKSIIAHLRNAGSEAEERLETVSCIWWLVHFSFFSLTTLYFCLPVSYIAHKFKRFKLCNQIFYKHLIEEMF